jgi:hypothetical protein
MTGRRLYGAKSDHRWQTGGPAVSAVDYMTAITAVPLRQRHVCVCVMRMHVCEFDDLSNRYAERNLADVACVAQE